MSEETRRLNNPNPSGAKYSAAELRGRRCDMWRVFLTVAATEEVSAAVSFDSHAAAMKYITRKFKERRAA